MDELVHVVYCSRSDTSLTPSAILRMVEQAQSRNRRVGISGMLLFGHGCFLQAIEGPRKAVSDLYHHIMRDERHHEMMLVDFSYKQQRDFAKWGMGLYDIARNKDPKIAALCGEGDFDPFAMGRARSMELLYLAADSLDSA